MTPNYTSIAFVSERPTCVSNAYGCFNTDNRSIEIWRGVPPHRLFQVIVHEMGHSFRIGHVQDFHGIMSPTLDVAKEYITNHDIEFVCQHHKCPCREPEY